MSEKINPHQKSIEEAYSLVDKAKSFIKNFEFRGSQRDICAAIIAQYIIDKETSIILEAPTGSGKSIIAAICSIAISIKEENKAKTFILTSDRMLQRQYKDSFDEICKMSNGVLFGQKNYECVETKTPFNEGYCIKNKLSAVKARSLECYKKCGYFQARDKAVSSNIAVLNYNNWLLHQNKVNRGGAVVFEKRNATFFDECHKLDDIVQNMFSFTLSTGMINKNFDKLEVIEKFHEASFKNSEYVGDKYKTYKELNRIRFKLVSFIDRISEELSNEKKQELLDEYENISAEIVEFMNTVIELMIELFDFDPLNFELEGLPKDWQDIVEALDNLQNSVHYAFKEYKGYLDGDLNNMVIDKYEYENYGQDKVIKVEFRSVNLSGLIKKTVLDQSNFSVFMSATIGNLKRFAELSGITKFKPISVDSTFNFHNSNIVRICKHNLANRHKAANIGPAIELIDSLIDHQIHRNQKGLIHTGNYYFSDMLKSYSKHADRLLTYRGTEEKFKALDRHKLSDNTILVGPSLVEGISLDDDLCRFMILLKTPYPNLTDNLVKKRMKQLPGWYEHTTLREILQMLGRPIRHKDDSCATYLIDTSFHRFFTQGLFSNFPQYISRRVK